MATKKTTQNHAREHAIREAAAKAMGRPSPREPNDPPVQTPGTGHFWVGDDEKAGN